jgi:hypothetical protein
MPRFGGVESTPNGESSDGLGFPKDHPRDTRGLPSLLSSCYPITLKVLSFSSAFMTSSLRSHIIDLLFNHFRAVRGRVLPGED